MRSWSVKILVVVVGLAVAAALVFTCDAGWQPPPRLSYVGSKTCATCHEQQHGQWQGSHHDLAMQEATATTVLGDFADVDFRADGASYLFFRRANDFYVRTQGAAGTGKEFKITHVFGVEPLQQYLVEFPGGRKQALRASWDTRPKAEGGQRWFHLYPGQTILPGDQLHWTGRRQNWNLMCAGCHSTNLRKNYGQVEDSYNTSWSEIDVGCEACHGPGSRHVDWARARKEGGQANSDRGKEKDKEKDNGLTVSLRNAATWDMQAQKRTATRNPVRTSHAEVETCAPCHSRRTQIREAHHGLPFLDAHEPSLLRDPLYHADGQIRDEVYVWGSFVQSRMFHHGVTCSDCHDPHSLELKGTGNKLCARCHDQTYYDTPSHHHHKPGSKAAECVECHMPATNYMVVDPRRDHSIRIPRPDLSRTLNVPNACNGCHDNQTALWAWEAIRKWRPAYQPRPHFAATLAKAWRAPDTAEADLLQLVGDAEQPVIARATALDLLGDGPHSPRPETLQTYLRDERPLIRMAAVRATASLPASQRVPLMLPLLDDKVGAVRLEVARVLAPVAGNILGPQRAKVDAVLEEYVQAQVLNADWEESWLKLGVLYSDLRRHDEAEAAYRRALVLNPWSVQASFNLADLYRERKRDGDGEKVLLAGIGRNPEDASLHHALGLLLVRQKRPEEARRHLEAAVRLQALNPRYSYVLGVALNDMGHPHHAIQVLEAAHRRMPEDRSLLYALITILRDAGRLDEAIGYGEKLVAATPGNPGSQQLLDDLRRARDRKR